MKTIEKSKLPPRAKAVVIIAIILAALITMTVIVSVIINILTPEEGPVLPEIREELGEAHYVGQPIAYERLKEVEILSLYVENEYGAFDMARWPNDNGEFWFGYKANDGTETMLQYLPPILNAEEGFDYESLYASENADGYGQMYMLSYLCTAIGTPYFTVRIDLPTGEDEESQKRRAELLREYGFDSEKVNRVSFAWGKRDAKNNIIEEGKHHIVIGDKAISGLGRYFRVDGRDCIYYSGNSQLEYAMMGFHAFVKGTLVAQGLPTDSAYEPMLTTGFKQWINQMVKDGEVKAGSTVAAKVNVYTPIVESTIFTPEKHPDGIQTIVGRDADFDLERLKSDPNYKRILNALVGKKVGECDDLFITMINAIGSDDDTLVSISGDTKLAYTYTVTGIEAVITDESEAHTPGAPVTEGSRLAVAYNYSIDGVAKNTIPRRAIIDLNSELIPDEAKEALLASTVGTLATPITYVIEYGSENTFCNFEEFIIEDIFAVYDKDGKTVEKVNESAYVAVRYCKNINGKKSELTSMTVYMPDLIKTEKWKPLYDALYGRSKSEGLNLSIFRNNYYYEDLATYSTVEVKEIEFFIMPELIVSFRFNNASKRDPFYGESIYENMMTNKYKLYGIDAEVCHEIIKRIGGIGDTSNQSDGLSGKTVAIGLDHATKLKYNLYDYTIYFELPRYITDADGDQVSDQAADFKWDHTIGFMLYISKPDPERPHVRYVGSDMYDLVAEVDADIFDFIDKSFADYWARRNMILIDMANVDSFKVEFNMTDVYGDYDFDIRRQNVYVGWYNDVFGVYTKPFEGSQEVEKYFVNVTEGEGAMHTVVSDLASKYGSSTVSATKIYDTVLGGNNLLIDGSYTETVGVANAMSVYEVMMTTVYTGTLTKAEQEAAFKTEKLMSFSIKLEGDNASGFTYVYDFYRVSDRKVMVALYQVDSDGIAATSVVSDYYISSVAFKKIVGAYLDFFNGVTVDGEKPYHDEK